jgi:hypothetical protein
LSADVEPVLEHQDRLAPTGWAHQFPRAISFSACASTAKLGRELVHGSAGRERGDAEPTRNSRGAG